MSIHTGWLSSGTGSCAAVSRWGDPVNDRRSTRTATTSFRSTTTVLVRRRGIHNRLEEEFDKCQYLHEEADNRSQHSPLFRQPRFFVLYDFAVDDSRHEQSPRPKKIAKDGRGGPQSISMRRSKAIRFVVRDDRPADLSHERERGR